jgi:hypothetical protein
MDLLLHLQEYYLSQLLPIPIKLVLQLLFKAIAVFYSYEQSK